MRLGGYSRLSDQESLLWGGDFLGQDPYFGCPGLCWQLRSVSLGFTGPKELPDFVDSSSGRELSPAENSLCDYFHNSPEEV